MSTEEILRIEFEKLRDDLRIRYFYLGMKASGSWEKNLEVVTASNSVKLIGAKYTEQLIYGRRPGKFPPIKAIEQWLKDKGIRPISEKMKISSLAFLIARKIANDGTNYFKKGGTDLVSAVITPQRIQEIINKVGVVNIGQFSADIIGELKKMAA